MTQVTVSADQTGVIGEQEFHTAALADDAPRLSMLFDQNPGSKVELLNRPNAVGLTVLHVAAEGDSVASIHEIARILKQGNQSDIERVLTERSTDGDTAFHIAVKKNNLSAVHALHCVVADHPRESIVMATEDAEGLTFPQVAIQLQRQEMIHLINCK